MQPNAESETVQHTVLPSQLLCDMKSTQQCNTRDIKSLAWCCTKYCHLSCSVKSRQLNSAIQRIYKIYCMVLQSTVQYKRDIKSIAWLHGPIGFHWTLYIVQCNSVPSWLPCSIGGNPVQDIYCYNASSVM